MSEDLDRVKADVTEATVQLPKLGGLGVLVPGNLILTAAHCISWESSGGMMLGDFYIEEVECREHRVKVRPLAVEPVSDIAVLGGLDNQEFNQEATAFDAFCENTKPISICTEVPLDVEFRVYFLTHEGLWIGAEARRWHDDSPCLWFDVDAGKAIRGGTSGSAIVNEQGKLVGIVSNAVGAGGRTPCPHLALPVWAIRQIMEADGQEETP